ncbi:MAG: hypothetical protein AAGA67_07795 [Cyanobacteria bacterium P01_F01_bin.153]
MLTFAELIDDIEDELDGVLEDIDPNTLGPQISDFLDQNADSINDVLTGEPVSNALADGVNALVSGVVPDFSVTPDEIADVVDDALPIIGAIVGGPLSFAPVLSIATDLLTGEAVADLLGEGLDLWFDRDDYLARYPDIANAEVDPFLHFLQSGALEGRLIDIFDENFYLASNPDVASAVASDGFSSGWFHFLTNGFNEGRSPAPGVGGDIASAIANTINQLDNAGII